MKNAQLLLDAIHAAVRAGGAVMAVYGSDFAVETKADQSPLTLADRRSHEIIRDGLQGHGIPMISEEGRGIAFEERSGWDRLWIVDPLDGTKEFVKRNGEFTVNIALIEKGVPVMGVVYAPVKQWLYFGAQDIGAYKVTDVLPGVMEKGASGQEEAMTDLMGRGVRLPVDQQGHKIYTIVGSRSHGTPELEDFVAAKKKEKGAVDFIAAGSSLKICLVAEGAADIYPRLGPTMEWDTAAGQAVAECAGASVIVYEDKSPLRYNRRDMLNPWFVVERK